MSYIVNYDNFCTLNFEPQSSTSSWYSATSKLPSTTSSRSNSFRDDRALFIRRQPEPFFFIRDPLQVYRTSSLDDIRTRQQRVSSEISRNRCGRRSQYDRRKTSAYCNDNCRWPSVKSNRSRRNSGALSRTASSRSRRRSSSKTPTIPAVPEALKLEENVEEDMKRARRHRIAVWLVLSSFIFIAVSSILVVVVTLTHQSEHVYDANNSLTYYTFAKPSDLANDKENKLNVA